jgi:hypothetical protein
VTAQYSQYTELGRRPTSAATMESKTEKDSIFRRLSLSGLGQKLFLLPLARVLSLSSLNRSLIHFRSRFLVEKTSWGCQLLEITARVNFLPCEYAFFLLPLRSKNNKGAAAAGMTIIWIFCNIKQGLTMCVYPK